MTGTANNNNSDIPRKRAERWHKALHDKHVNVQVSNYERPSDEQGFLCLTLINHKGQVHRVTITATLRELLNRNAKYVEFFSTDGQGRKQGVSIEWRTEDEAYSHVTQEHFSEMRKQVQALAEADPTLAKTKGSWITDNGAGLLRHYDKDEAED